MPYADPNSIHNPTTGQVIPAAWGDQIRDDLEFLIDPPTCSVYATVAQSIPNNDTTVLVAGGETRDNDAMHSTSSQTSRITIQTAGTYLFNPVVLFAADADGFRRVSLLKNGATAYGVPPSGMGDAANQGVRLGGTRLLVCAAADYVETTCLHTAGAALDALLEEFTATFVTR